MYKLLFFILAITLIFIKCEQETYHNIDKNTWYLFDEGDTIFYMNQGIRADTFIIDCFESGYDVHDKRYFYERIIVEFYPRNTWFLRSHNVVQLFWLGFGFSFYYEETPSSSYFLDDILFEDVYFKEEAYDPEYSEVVKIYYTDLYGIIAYELNNGEVYEIDVTRLPEKY